MTKRNTILVVDDQTNVRNILEFNLKRRGFDILAAQDGLAAITFALNNQPDLILLDIMMPGIDGFQVMEKLKGDERTANIPILIVSAKGTEEDILRAMKLGAKDYIVKPFNLDQLMQKTFKLLKDSASVSAAAEKEQEEETPVATSWPSYALIRLGAAYPVDDEELARQLTRIADAGVKVLLLDLTATGSVSTLAFGKLARVQQTLKKAGAELKLITANAQHTQTLAEANFSKHFEVLPGWDEAMLVIQP